MHFAAKENLKLNFQIDGSVWSGLLLRNVHAVPTGPSAVEAIDADLVRVDYSIPDLIFHGLSDFLKNVEVNSASIVLDPRKALPPKPPKPNEQITSPAIFPDRVQLSDINLIIHSATEDLLLRNLNLGLYPQREGNLQIDQLLIPNVHAWSHICAATSYQNKNLFLRNLVFDQENQFRLVNLDASHIGSKSVGLAIDGSIGQGRISGSVVLREAKHSLETNIKLNGDGISLAKLSEYFGRTSGLVAG